MLSNDARKPASARLMQRRSHMRDLAYLLSKYHGT